jgi:DNA-binding XRE family transcriptional regulator
MPRHVSESDWRTFRDLREAALDRFCRRVLEEVQLLSQEASRSSHERYLDVYRLMRARDKELAHAFDDPRRSRMLWQLAAIHRHGLLESAELARLSQATREAIELLANELVRKPNSSPPNGSALSRERRCSTCVRPRRDCDCRGVRQKDAADPEGSDRGVSEEAARLRRSGEGRTEAMRVGKRKRLVARGWAVGDARDFLGLTDEEAAFVELELALAHNLRQRRVKRGMTQTQLAKRLESSQSRVAKMEAGDRSVSLEPARALAAGGWDDTATACEGDRELGSFHAA